MVGGVGVCGLELCCATWLRKFDPISIRMAKDQNLVLNPQKVSGVCGRLKCCLAYEQAMYQELRAGLPKQGKRVMTPNGEGKVQEVDVLGGKIKVVFPSGSTETFSFAEIQACRGQAQPSEEAEEAAHDEPSLAAAAESFAEGEMPPEETEDQGVASAGPEVASESWAVDGDEDAGSEPEAGGPPSATS